MTKEIVLVTGAVRSGKSLHAERRAAALGARLIYLATAEAGDSEMAQRIAEHKKRRSKEWRTIEEPVDVVGRLLECRGTVDCALVECLTLWISNLLLRSGEAAVKEAVQNLIRALPSLDFHLVLVSNEVGWGIVPAEGLSRLFRDLVGWTNQSLGSVASEVVLLVAGIPLVIRQRVSGASHMHGPISRLNEPDPL